VPSLSKDLRTPVSLSERRPETLESLTIVAAEWLVAAKAANAKIKATDEIWTCYEAYASGDNCNLIAESD